MNRATQPRLAGMTLVEVVLALGIAAFAIIVVMGLLPTGLNSSREASHEQAATDILLEIEQEIRQTPAGLTNTPRLALPLPATADMSTEAYFSSHGLYLTNTNLPPPPVYRARVTRRQPANPALNTWHVVVEWPALAPANGSVETLVIRPNSSAL